MRTQPPTLPSTSRMPAPPKRCRPQSLSCGEDLLSGGWRERWSCLPGRQPWQLQPLVWHRWVASNGGGGPGSDSSWCGTGEWAARVRGGGVQVGGQMGEAALAATAVGVAQVGGQQRGEGLRIQSGQTDQSCRPALMEMPARAGVTVSWCVWVWGGGGRSLPSSRTFMWRSAGSEGTGRDPGIRNSLHTVSIIRKFQSHPNRRCPPPRISSLPCSGAARRASAALLGRPCSRTTAALSAGKRGSDGALAPATVPLSGSGHHCSMSSHHAHHNTHAVPPSPPRTPPSQAVR